MLRKLNFRITTAFFNYFIRWRITLLKQRGVCELSEIAKTFSIVYEKVFRLFIYLIVSKHGSRGRIARRVASVYRESLCGFNSQCVNMSIIWVSSDKHSTNINLDMKQCQILKQHIAKNGLNANIFFRVREKRRKNLPWLLANAWKTMVTVDWRPPKGRFELKKKPFEGAC